MKNCVECRINKNICEFNRDASRADGLRYSCKDCCRDYRVKNKQKISRYHKERIKANPEKQRKHRREQYLKHRDSVLIYSSNYNKTYRKENRQKYLSSMCNYRKANRSYFNHQSGVYRAKKLNATPSWLSKDHLVAIKEFYDLAKELSWLSESPLEVDHIVPIQGKNVCGLHVPWNMQILPKSMNIAKGNR